jgi:putative methyltransferase (TIGR04325 family)
MDIETGDPVRHLRAYATWDEAVQHCDDFSKREVVEKTIEATHKVVRGDVAYERDTVTFDKIQYSWPLLAGLLLVACRRGSLRVVDFGGALGSSYRQNRKFLDEAGLPVAWNVVELPAYVEAGNSDFSSPALRFYRSFSEITGGVDAVLFLGSLFYVRDPYAVLADAISLSPPYIIFDRTPITDNSYDEVVIQSVSEPIYTARFPMWRFSKHKLFQAVQTRYTLLEEWPCEFQEDVHSVSSGFLFRLA